MRALPLKAIVFTALLAVTQLVACQGPEDADAADSTSEPRESSGMRITANTLAQLASNAYLRLEALEQEDVLVFDPASGPIDYARIVLVTGEQQLPMDRWLQDAAREQGVDAKTLESRVLTVKLTGASVELVSLDRSGPQQQQNCSPDNPACCEICCTYSYDCYYDFYIQRWFCYCAVWSCCGSTQSVTAAAPR
jgi:hypothetical protein